MKLSLRLILSLVVSISAATFVVSRSLVRAEKDRISSDLVHRAETLADSLQEAVEPVLQHSSQLRLQQIVDRFSNREHLLGIVIYGKENESTGRQR